MKALAENALVEIERTSSAIAVPSASSIASSAAARQWRQARLSQRRPTCCIRRSAASFERATLSRVSVASSPGAERTKEDLEGDTD